MNFKSLALATTIAITGLISAPGAQAKTDRDLAKDIVDRHEVIALEAYNREDWATMCRSEGTMLHMNGIFPGLLVSKFERQTNLNVRKCRAAGYSVETMETIAGTGLSDADMDFLWGAMTGGPGSAPAPQVRTSVVSGGRTWSCPTGRAWGGMVTPSYANGCN